MQIHSAGIKDLSSEGWHQSKYSLRPLQSSEPNLYVVRYMKSWWDAFIPSSFAHHFSVFTKAYLVAQFDCNSSPWHWNPSGRLLPYDMVPSVEIQSCTQPQCVWKSLCVGPALFIGEFCTSDFLGYFSFKGMSSENLFHWRTEVRISLEMPCWTTTVLLLYCVVFFVVFFFSIFLGVQVLQICFKKWNFIHCKILIPTITTKSCGFILSIIHSSFERRFYSLE